MLWTIAIIPIILGLFGVVTSYTRDRAPSRFLGSRPGGETAPEDSASEKQSTTISMQGPADATNVERYTRLVRRVLDVPVVCISIFDADGWLTTSSRGQPPPNAMLMAWSFVKRTRADGQPLVIVDARRDSRFETMPAVQDGMVTAYLGMKLVAPGGRVVGTLSAMDVKPRRWSARDIGFTREVGGWLVAERDRRAADGRLIETAVAVSAQVG